MMLTSGHSPKFTVSQQSLQPTLPDDVDPLPPDVPQCLGEKIYVCIYLIYTYPAKKIHIAMYMYIHFVCAQEAARTDPNTAERTARHCIRTTYKIFAYVCLYM